MKTISIIPLFAVLAAASLQGCVSLDEEVESSLVSQDFYKNEADALSAVNACYYGLRPGSGQILYNTLFQVTHEMATDDHIAGSRARNAHTRQCSELTYDATNERFDQIWGQSYRSINYCNVAIDRIAQISADAISEENREQYIAQAKALRALHYFNLVRWFRNVPIVLHETTSLTPENLYVSQASPEETYAQIEQDLKDAEAVLPVSYSAENVGRVTRGAAQTILAKVYLTQGKWQQAADKAKEIIDSKVYALFEDYADVFAVDKENTVEHIFSIQCKGNSNLRGNPLSVRSIPSTVPGLNGDCADEYNEKSDLYDSYSPTDRRREVNFLTEIVSPTTGKLYTQEELGKPYFFMYYDETVVGNQSESSKNIPIIRYAEVLLIYAEALNELSGPTAEAYDALDQVRTRAKDTALADVAPALSQDEFREYVLEERRKEFVYQYHRWFDLVRHGSDYYVRKLHAAGKSNAEPKHVILPIPQLELDRNPNLKQNPEWE